MAYPRFANEKVTRLKIGRKNKLKNTKYFLESFILNFYKYINKNLY